MKLPKSVRIWFISVVLLSIDPSHGRPQERGDSASPPLVRQQEDRTLIRINSNLVTVPVSVTDASGRPVRDLRMADFAIEENGRPEPLSRIAEPGQTPLELALLIDVSGSTESRFDFEVQAAARFIRRVLRPEDAFAIFSIGPQPGLIHGRTSNLDEGIHSLSAMVPSHNSTAFYDSIVLAAQFLGRKKSPGIRRVQIVISDGEDNNSESYRLAEALQQVQRADCVFYSINPGGPSIRLNKISLEGQNGMEQLAALTGGVAYVPDRAEELDAIFDRVTSELRAQYLLEYYSSDQRKDGVYRQIGVRLPNRPGLRIHARQGYFAATG